MDLDLSSYFAGGMVEIAALTTLIGSSTAASLVLGNRGGAGLVWAAMSAFGILSIVKECIAGASPDWLRATLGVRDNVVDAALGLRLDLRSRYKSRQDLARRDLGRAEGIAVMVPVAKEERTSSSSAWTRRKRLPAMVDVYAFDRFVASPLNSVLTSPKGNLPTVYIFVRDPRFRPVTRGDWIALGLAGAKAAEVYALWKLGTTPLCWVAALPCMWFLLAAIVLQGLKSTRGYLTDNAAQAEIDSLSGELPTAKIPGGSKKILLRMPENFRRSVLWKLTWGAGAVVCLTSLLATYVLLSREDANTFFAWLGFQLFWLAARLVFYHVVEGTDDVRFPGLVGQEWDKLSSEHKPRALGLLWALAAYHTHMHPRGSYSYVEDMQSLDKVDSLLPSLRGEYRTIVPALPSAHQLVTVVLHGVLGDTLLSSASWLTGSKLAGMDVYDSVVVVMEVAGSRVAVPGVRVLSGTSLQAEIAKWIPCADGRWLQFQTEDMKVLGRRQAMVVTDVEVSKRLDRPDMNVSFASVDDVKDTLRHSIEAVEALRRLL
ncbi:hypothetical protein BR93DRAFT_632607 [Coniochaeta sp. PMI_546]|nr:hypothetical protein BR93DRAFT_632607 [Coniochaeta sp. PMI_546]